MTTVYAHVQNMKTNALTKTSWNFIKIQTCTDLRAISHNVIKEKKCNTLNPVITEKES